MVSIELKIKLNDGTDVVLDSEHAKELYEKLKEIYGKNDTVITYPVVPYSPVIYPTQPSPVWYSSFQTTLTQVDSVSTVSKTSSNL